MYRHLRKSSVFGFIIPLLVLSLILPGNLTARAKRTRGMKITVNKISGEAIKGRLVKVNVNEGWLVVKPWDALAGTRVHIDDVYDMKVKDGKMGGAVGGGFVFGLVLGLVMWVGTKPEPDGLARAARGLMIPASGLLGLGIGAIAGLGTVAAGRRIKVNGKSAERKQNILKKLKRKAMIIY
jgi:hypothetical protein